MLGIAILLWVLGVALIPVVAGIDPKTKADNVILNGIPFILIFIGVIIAFIDSIIFAATKWSNKISARTFSIVERILIGGIVLGGIGMFQPFIFAWYTIGFVVLLISLLGYIFWSHIIPRLPVEIVAHPHEGLGSVSIGEIEKHSVQG